MYGKRKYVWFHVLSSYFCQNHNPYVSFSGTSEWNGNLSLTGVSEHTGNVNIG